MPQFVVGNQIEQASETLDIAAQITRLEIDDAVGAFPVHAGGGVWGTLAVGLFASRETMAAMEVTRGGLIGIQLTGILATFVWAFGLSFLIFWISYF